MVSVRFLCELKQKFGLINFHNFQKPWQRKLQSFYFFFQLSLLIIPLGGHFFSTISRAYRHEAELYQMIMEDVYMIKTLIGVIHFGRNYRQINKIIGMMDTFIKPDKSIGGRLSKKTNILFFGNTLITIAAGSTFFIEVVLPMTAEELEIRRHVYYNVEHPERKLPFNLRFPNVDETEWFNYVFFFLLECYDAVLILIMFIVCCTLIPLCLYHQRAQYEILAKYISKLGKEPEAHRKSKIHYSNIQRRDSILKYYPRTQMNAGEFDKREMKVKEDFERNLIRRIVRHHQKLECFQRQVTTLASPLVLWLVIFNCVLVSICIHQLILDPNHVPKPRYFKFVASSVAVLVEIFITCNGSEKADEGHTLLYSALLHCQWHQCALSTQKDLCILFRRIQKNNHMRFYNGALIINRRSFVHVVKVGYNFLNFLRIGSEKT